MKQNLVRVVSIIALGMLMALLAVEPMLAGKHATADAQTKATQKVVVHLSQSDGDAALHSALMGFGLAAAMRQQGADVIVMLDSEAPALAKKSWADKTLSTAGKDPSHPPMTLGKAIQRFVDAGGKIVMCPHCAASCGCEVSDLADGAKMGQQGELAQVVLNADKILDY